MLLACAAAYGIWYYLAYKRPSIEYYAAATYRHWVFEGVVPLTVNQTLGRSKSYRVIRHGYRGPVDRVEIINGEGRLHRFEQFGAAIESTAYYDNATTDDQRTCVTEFSATTPASCWKCARFNRANQLVWVFHLLEWPTAGYFQHVERDPAGQTLKPSALAESAEWNARHAHQGQLRQERLDHRDALISTAPGNRPEAAEGYGSRTERDERGLAARWTYLGVDGQPTPLSTGLAAQVAEYDAMGNQTRMRMLDKDNKPMLNDYGIAIVEFDVRRPRPADAAAFSRHRR